MFKETLNYIKENKENVESGLVNCIPSPFPRLRNYIPGTVRGQNWIITANSGVGKTQLTKHMFVFHPYEWVKNNPTSKIKLKILYFALEESKREFSLTLMCNRLYSKYGIKIDTLKLQSMFDSPVSNTIIKKIEEDAEYYQDFEECVDVIDSISDPYGIYNRVRDYSNENGVHFYRPLNNKSTLPIIKREEYDSLPESSRKKYCYSHYVANDPNEYVIVIVDHFSLLKTNKLSPKLHDAMTKMSSEYGRKNITKHWNYVFVNVQQQASESEKQQYTNTGVSIESKLEPSLAGLGDNKLTQRDAHIVLGLFAPDRYELSNHLGYNIKELKDNYRSINVLKNRVGRSNLKLPCYFNGEYNYFEELPSVVNNQWYEEFKKDRSRLPDVTPTTPSFTTNKTM